MNLVAPAGDEMDASGQDFKSQVALNSRASLLRPAQSVSECSHAPLVLNGLSHFAVLYPHLASQSLNHSRAPNRPYAVEGSSVSQPCGERLERIAFERISRSGFPMPLRSISS
jgi:hypothetical protein